MYDPKVEPYWDQSHHEGEIRRIFNICHGCRLCFNLCPSFVDLFGAIDAKDENPENLDRQDYERIGDLCYECRLCYLRCPYTPPHEFNLDFPRLMLRGKALNAKKSGIKLRDRLMGNTDLLGTLGKYTAPLANFGNSFAPVRLVMEKAVGVSSQARLPRYHWQTFRDWFVGRQGSKPAEPAAKVALFYTCMVNYNVPDEGKAMVRVLEHNNVEMALPRQRCCGIPYLDGGNVEAAQGNARSNVEALAERVRQGYDIVAPESTCAYVLKFEYPLLVAGADGELVAKHTYDISEYLGKMNREGKLKKEFVKNP
ncbi:MAG: heterodisulfide reductase-related iron-sulfur binding cluster, partial [Dehalococcoidia bacterium]